VSVAIAEMPSVLHMLPGRVRVHVPEWSGQGKRKVETVLREVQGISRVQTNALTGNILIHFDPILTSEQTVLGAVQTLTFDTTTTPEEEPPPPPVVRERQGRTIRARIAVRGLDRHPHLARRVVEHLERRFPGVRATASQLTGRVLVEFTEHEAELEDLTAAVAELEVPALPGEDRPAYPLDLGPLIQSATRTIGSALGLGLLVARRLLGHTEPLPGASAALRTSSIIGILQGIPPVRYGLRRLLGRTAADLLVNIPGIITLTIAESSLGLAVIGAESLRLLTEIRARRDAWRQYEEREQTAPSSRPAATIHLEAGQRSPLSARVIEGAGTAIGRDSLPLPVLPGSIIPPGSRLYGGPFTLKLQSDETFQPFTPQARPAPFAPSLYSRYLRVVSPLSLVYAAAAALFTRSFDQTLAALLLVNPRVAAIGLDSADIGAAARVLRAGVTVLGTRKRRTVRLPGFVLLDSARVITNGLEFSHALTLTEEFNAPTLLALATGVSAAARSPWGRIFKTAATASATEGTFDGKVARATIKGVRYTLGPIEDWSLVPEASSLRQRGNYVLALHREGEQRPLGVFALCSRLAPGIAELTQCCQRHGVQLAMLNAGDQIVAQEIARRAGVALIDGDKALEVIQARQAEGACVAFVSDNAGAAAAFEACDLAIGLTNGGGYLSARADLLAPDLTTIAAVIEAGARREATVRDSVGLSLIANIIGALWGLRGIPGVALASRVVYIAALAVIADGWLRLRGGQRPGPTISHLADPHPERWGQLDTASVLQNFRSSEAGLTSIEAAQRQQTTSPQAQRNKLLITILDQARSPLIGILAVGAGFSLFLGAITDAVIIGTTILVSIAVNTWQENKANKTTEMLQNLGTPTARVLRDGQVTTIPSNEVVPGDILMLAHGDHVAADARIADSNGLEVDEAALTGESLPVPKVATEGTDASRIVLAGSDVTSGTALAVAVAVGDKTRMGATVAALSKEDMETSPLSTRLARMLRTFLPISIAGGTTIIGAGLLRGQPLTFVLAIGATIALAGVPEGLPLLAKVGETGVARRLSIRDALVRRLSAVEALGRVDIACTDKTGTLTKGRLSLSMVAGPVAAGLPRLEPGMSRLEPGLPRLEPGMSRLEPGMSRPEPGMSRPEPGMSRLEPGMSRLEPGMSRLEPGMSRLNPNLPHLDPNLPHFEPSLPRLEEAKVPGKLSPHLQHVLITAALASPHPDASDASAHPTDIAIIQGALDEGLSKQIRIPHEAEAPFDPSRGFHATLAQGRLCIKGAPEVVLPHCSWVLRRGQKCPLMDGDKPTPLRNELLSHARRLAGRGLRLLLVAEGPPDTAIDNPEALTALGFVGISDPLRATAPIAVRRCQEAGVRVIMITGDHPDTARAIAQESGLLDGGDTMLTGTEIAELDEEELSKHLEHTAVIARATPLDKLRIIECLRSKGHTVAMTGDGVNDAPALRLADVGVAMGAGSTEVARQIADIVITNDDFSTLVEAFVEGRSFWRNIRRSLGLLLGGNLGELGLVVGATLLGLESPLTTRQILAVNMITDILPALAVALQPPEHRNLAGLRREGAAALDKPLSTDIAQRAALSALPTLATYLLMLRRGVPQARTAAFVSIVATQLAQTLEVGRSEGSLTPSVFSAVAGSAAVLLAALTLPPLRNFLNLAALPPLGWLLIGGGALTAAGLSRVLS
jgi:magnesium-transporting ATPase (P-type)